MRNFGSGDAGSEAEVQVVVRNLPEMLNENGVRHLFGTVSKVRRVHYRKPTPKNKKISALVIYEKDSMAEKAIRKFDGFQIGEDGPALSVFRAKTFEEKMALKKQKAMEEKFRDEVSRMPGFSKEPMLFNYGVEKAEKPEEGDKTAAISDEWTLALKRQMHIVDEGARSEVVSKDELTDLAQLALELDLLRFCQGCKKECAFGCCDSAPYCSIACQKKDRDNHKECRAVM